MKCITSICVISVGVKRHRPNLPNARDIIGTIPWPEDDLERLRLIHLGKFDEPVPDVLIPLPESKATELKLSDDVYQSCQENPDISSYPCREILKAKFYDGPEMSANVYVTHFISSLLSLFLSMPPFETLNSTIPESQSLYRPDGVIRVYLDGRSVIGIICEFKSSTHFTDISQAVNDLTHKPLLEDFYRQPPNARYHYGFAMVGRCWQLFLIYHDGNSVVAKELTRIHDIIENVETLPYAIMRVARDSMTWKPPEVPRFPQMMKVDRDRAVLDFGIVNVIKKYQTLPRNASTIEQIYSLKLPHLVSGSFENDKEKMEKCYSVTDNESYFCDTVEHKQAIMNDVRAALDEMHHKGIAHCDVRMPNVLATLTLRSSRWRWDDSPPKFVLCDFEFSRPIGDSVQRSENLKEFPQDIDSISAIDLDEYQYGKLCHSANAVLRRA